MQVAGHAKTAPVGWTRAARVALLTLTGLLLVVAFAVGWAKMHTAVGVPGAIGFDLAMYVERTQSWLDGTGFYLPHQITGQPYTVADGDAMYPPVVMALMLPWVVGVPWLLWWAIPIGITAVSLRAMRPAMWTLPLLAAALAYPRTWIMLICGNPSMWAFAFLAAGMVWKWPAAFVPMKLTLAPFALVGVRHRSFWKAAGIGLLACIPFGLTWLAWPVATLNARAPLDYVLGEWPIAAAIIVAGWSRANDDRKDAVLRLRGGDGLREGGRGDAVVGLQERGIGLD